MKRVVVGLGVVLLLLVAVVLFRTLTVPSRQVSAQPAHPLAQDSGKLLRDLAGAVAIPTVSVKGQGTGDKTSFDRFHQYLAQTFPLMHQHLEKTVVNGYSLIYRWPGTDPTLDPVLYLAHQDVVPIDPATRSQWKHAPFSGEIADGYLWGRGSIDDKSSLMGLCESVEYLLSQGYKPQRTIYLAFGHDEEIGGVHGAQVIAETLAKENLHFAYVLDEGMFIGTDLFPELAKPVALIGLGEKGYVTLELSAQDEGGHSSRPRPHTTIGIISKAVYDLESHPLPARMTPPVEGMWDYLGPEMPFFKRMLFANRWLFRDVLIRFMVQTPNTNALLRTTGAATMIGGGVKENVLPNRTWVRINFRLLPGDTLDKVKQYVVSTINNPKIQVSQSSDFNSEPSPVSDYHDPSFQLLQETTQAVFGKVIVTPTLLVAGSDARHYGALSSQIYRYQPVLLTKADTAKFHGVNESIQTDAYLKLVQFYTELMQRSSNSGSSQFLGRQVKAP